MTTTLRKTLFTAIAAGMIAATGPGLSPAKADPAFAELLGEVIREVGDQRRHRGDRVTRHWHDPDDFRFGDRRYRKHHRHGDRKYHRRDWSRHEELSRGVRGLYLPGYDMERVLRWNYSGHRH